MDTAYRFHTLGGTAFGEMSLGTTFGWLADDHECGDGSSHVCGEGSSVFSISMANIRETISSLLPFPAIHGVGRRLNCDHGAGVMSAVVVGCVSV
jgi:hypothetical protein